MARPTVYTPELAAEICRRLAEHGSLRRACNDPGMPTDDRVRLWVSEHKDFAGAYARAKSAGIDALVEQTLDLADGVTDKDAVPAAKLQIKTRHWLAERLEARKYGARSGIDLTSSDGSVGMDETTRAARLKALLALAEKRKAAPSIDDLV